MPEDEHGFDANEPGAPVVDAGVIESSLKRRPVSTDAEAMTMTA